MANPNAALSPLPAAQPAEHRTLLADLESRQDELLRLLSDLEERTKQALVQLSPLAAQANSASASSPASSSATSISATSGEAPVHHEKRAA